ncbi:hypothetical protein ABSL23_12235 [Halobacterium sp. NMX12-1]|uniref:Uncharacterized protein n=1 Tax=Halobacterium sp. NMX12-1 TaxID=3166650 RepID=A0AAU8CC10_9EURY
MSPSTTRTQHDGPREAPSLVHLLLVWFLVGGSFVGLGIDLHGALSVDAPPAAINAGLVFGTVVVAALWVAGFRPSLRASVGYFLLQNAAQLLLLIAVVSAASPWTEVAVRALSIAFAGALCFTDPGRRTVGWLRDQCWQLFESQAVS